MNRTNLKYIIRSVWKNKIFSFVNILGLSIGLSSAIIIYLFIEFELSFDRFYQDNDQIYRVVSTSQHASGTDKDGATSYPLGYSLRNDFPEFKIASLYMAESQNIILGKEVYKEENILYVDSLYFDIFKHNWILGSPELLNKHPENIALSKSVARKFFGDENPIGRIITFSPDKNLQVVGLLEDPPLNSSNKYSMILSIQNLNAELIGINYDTWGTTLSGFESYFKIPSSVDIASVENRINNLINDKYLEGETDNQNLYGLQSITYIHLSPDYENMPNSYTTSTSSLWVYTFIGLLIICIAGINFINLSTAQGIKRSKEVGVRKVLGANKAQVSFHFIKEYAFISFLALIIAAIIVEIILPYINIFLGQNHALSIYNSRYFIPFFLVLYLVINLITSLYPSLVMSRFMPVKALKGNIGNPKQNVFSLRNALLVFQFTISIALIIGTIVIKKQINFINNKDLGFSIDHIIDFTLPENDSAKIESLRSFLRSEPGVESFGFGLGAPTSNSNFRTSFTVAGEDTKYYLNLKISDAGYINVFDLDLIAGEWFNERTSEDTVFKLVANEKLCKIHGFANEFEALNKKIPFGGNHGVICGVVKDFHTSSLKSEIDPAAFVSVPSYYYALYVKIEENRMNETLVNIENYIAGMFPTYFIEHQSMKENLNDMYSEEDRTATIITVLSALAILIASLGLFGLFSFMIVQKIKEIGIRKVLGASLNQIAFLLTQSYIKLLIVASCLAIPLAWYFMDRWLNEFAYRIKIGIWVYLLAVVIALCIALITIIFQVLKTGRMNPVDALKYE